VRDVAALIVAAGQGSRFGGELPKVFVDLAGSPLLVWALRAYDCHPCVNRLLLAVAQEHIGRAEAICVRARLTRRVQIVVGGERRQDTVVRGLESLRHDPPRIIAIHDGARPLVDRRTISGSIRLAARFGGCVTAASVTDTIKHADAQAVVVATPDRASLWRAQTPQTFGYDLLTECYRRAAAEGWEVTDDASVLELCGHPVHINPGPGTNLKVTTPEDLKIAAALMGHDPTVRDGSGVTNGRAVVRVGSGYDVHALVPGRRLVLGGVGIPHETGLAGHSDADVLLHAVCDALLGAAALGDIGVLFPDSDAAFKDMDSAVFCRRAAQEVRAAGYEIGNVDATVIAQRPKLAPHIPQMRANIAEALGVPLDRVSVKATTTERLGFAGREEGIAAEAVATVVRGG